MVVCVIKTDEKYSDKVSEYVKSSSLRIALSPLIRRGKMKKYTIPSTKENLVVFTGRDWGIINPLYMGIVISGLFGLMWGWDNWGVYIGCIIMLFSFLLSETFNRSMLVKGLKKLDPSITTSSMKSEEFVQLLQEDDLQWDKS